MLEGQQIPRDPRWTVLEINSFMLDLMRATSEPMEVAWDAVHQAGWEPEDCYIKKFRGVCVIGQGSKDTDTLVIRGTALGTAENLEVFSVETLWRITAILHDELLLGPQISVTETWLRPIPNKG